MLLKLSAEDTQQKPANNTKRYLKAGIGGTVAGYLGGAIVPRIMQTPKMELLARGIAAPAVGALIAKKILNKDSGSHGNDNLAIAGGVGAYGGKRLLQDAYNSGELTGRITLWHGTSPWSAKSIRENGIEVSTPQNSVDTINLIDHDPEMGRRALNKVYTTTDKNYAKYYAAQATAGGSENFAKEVAKDPSAYFTRQRQAVKGGGLVKINLPVEIMKNRVINPEVDMPFEEYKRTGYAPGPFPANEYNNLRERGVVFPHRIESKFVVGGNGYLKNSPKEILTHIKTHPKMFLKGVGKSGLGLAGLAAAVYSAKRTHENYQAERAGKETNVN